MKINSVSNISFQANEQLAKKLDPVANAACSAMFPGLGQFEDNRKKEGWFFLAGATILNITSTLLNSKQAKNIKKTLPAVEESALEKVVSFLFDESGISNLQKSIKNSSKAPSRFLSVAPIAAAAAAVVFWTVNVIDAYRGGKNNSKPTNE